MLTSAMHWASLAAHEQGFCVVSKCIQRAVQQHFDVDAAAKTVTSWLLWLFTETDSLEYSNTMS